MKQLPAIVSHIIEEHLAVLLLWCSHYLYERLWPHWQGDYLVQAAAQLNLTPIEQACAHYHQGASQGRGRPVNHTVPKMVRVLFLMYQANSSYRQAESRLRRDLLWRWFAGYDLFAATPDHNTIFLFDQYVRTYHPRLYFDTFLRQIDEKLPSERQQGQIGDTFAVLANAALEGPTHRLRHLCSQMLSLLDKQRPEAYAAVIHQVGSSVSAQHSAWAAPFWLTVAARKLSRRRPATSLSADTWPFFWPCCSIAGQMPLRLRCRNGRALNWSLPIWFCFMGHVMLVFAVRLRWITN
jgi:hypothetical protein